MSTSGDAELAGSRAVRVYHRRTPKMGSSTSEGEADGTREWASLPPKLLGKVFGKLEESDVKSAQETCAGSGGRWAEKPQYLSWTHTMDTILQHLHHLNQEMDAEVALMTQFLVQEGIMKAP